MRYRFSGLHRDTGEPLHGQVEADCEDQAYNLLGDDDVVVSHLQPDAEAANENRQPKIASAIEQALDSSSKQIRFDDLTNRYRGKRVWVINREKIRKRVTQTIDEVIRRSQNNAESDATTRDHITKALERLFGDHRNLTSPIGQKKESLEDQIGRLAGAVGDLKHAVGSIQAATQRSSISDRWHQTVYRRQANDETVTVLHEIFNNNLELRKRIAQSAQKTTEPNQAQETSESDSE